MKKILSLLLIFVMLLGSVPAVFAAASGNAIFTVKAPEYYPVKGETFTVQVEISGNPGFSALQFSMYYDKTKMQCLSANMGTVVSGAFGATNENASDGVRIGCASANAMTKNGVVLTATFKALEKITAFNFKINNMVFSDSASKDLKYSVVYPTGKNPTKPIDPQPPVDPVDPQPPVDPVDPEDPDTPAEDVKFTDVSDSYWGHDFIVKAVQQKLFGGYGNGKFGPEDQITRAQFITVLWRMAGCPSTNYKPKFTDISGQSEEFKTAIAWGAENNMINGLDSTHFNPDGKLKRQEAVKIMFYFAGGKSGQEGLYASIYDAAFRDMNQVAEWAKPAMYWSIYNEIIAGTGADTLSPNAFMTRAQVAKVLVIYKENH